MQNDKPGKHWRAQIDTSSSLGDEERFDPSDKEAAWQKLSRRLYIAGEDREPVAIGEDRKPVTIQEAAKKPWIIRRRNVAAAVFLIALGSAFFYLLTHKASEPALTEVPAAGAVIPPPAPPVTVAPARPERPGSMPATGESGKTAWNSTAGRQDIKKSNDTAAGRTNTRRLLTATHTPAVSPAAATMPDSLRPSVDEALLAGKLADPLTPKKRKVVHLNEIRTPQELLGIQPAKEQRRLSFFNRQEPAVTNPSSNSLVIPFNH